MNTMSVWKPKFVAVLALCAMAAGGCSKYYEVRVNSSATPQAVPLTGNRHPVTLLRIEDAITDSSFASDSAFLGEGLSQFGVLFFVFPFENTSYRFRDVRPRTDLVRSAFTAKLQSVALPIRYQSDGRFDQLTARDNGHLLISARLKEFQVDTKLNMILPLVVVHSFFFLNIKSHVELECQVFQPGSPTPVWHETVEGTMKSASEHFNQHGYIELSTMEALIRQSVMKAVEQFVQKSNIQQLIVRVQNEAYAKHIKAGQEREVSDDWKGAISDYGKAYGTAMTSDQSLATIQTVAQVIRKQSVKPELPEEAMRYGIQATSLVEKKRYDEAIVLFDQALELAPWWAESHFNKALVLANQSRNGEAATSMKQFLILAPNAPDARAAQNKIYEWELDNSQPTK